MQLTAQGRVLWTPAAVARRLADCRTAAQHGWDYRATSSGEDVVVLTYKTSVDRSCGPRRTVESAQALTVWQRREGRWRIVAYSEVPLAAAPAADADAADTSRLVLPALGLGQALGQAAGDLLLVTVAAVRDGRARGESPRAVCTRIARLAAPAWKVPAGTDPVRYVVRGISATLQGWPGSNPTLVESGPDGAAVRYRRTYAEWFGPRGARHGVSLAEFEECYGAFAPAIARAAGVDASVTVEGETALLRVTPAPAPR